MAEPMSIDEERVRPEREAALAEGWSLDKEKRAEKWWRSIEFITSLDNKM
jgi:hypothetical protein